MHIEHLGEKTLFMALDPEDIKIDEIGGGSLSFMNGSTETRINIPPAILSSLPDHPTMVTITGDAKLHISVNDDCQILGFEDINASDISPSLAAQREPGFVEAIPF